MAGKRRVVRFALELEFETGLRASDDEYDSKVREELDDAFSDPRIKSYTVIDQWADEPETETPGIQEHKAKLASEKYDPCAQCTPNPVTGNYPCDNGYLCEHMYIPITQ